MKKREPYLIGGVDINQCKTMQEFLLKYTMNTVTSTSLAQAVIDMDTVMNRENRLPVITA